MLITLIISAILYIITKDECDQILWHKDRCYFPNWGWYTESNWQTKSWWLKYPLSMFSDGWHFMDSLRNTMAGYFFSFCLLQDVNWWTLLIVSAFYSILGIYHNWRSGSFLGLGLDQNLNI